MSLDKIDRGEQQFSRRTFNGMVDAANSFANMGVVGMDRNDVGNPCLAVQEQPEMGTWARITDVVIDTDGNNILDGQCRLSYDWVEIERYSDDGVTVGWRDKVQVQRHSIPLDNGSQHVLREINGKTLHVGDRVWVYPGCALFNGPRPNDTSSNWEHLCVAPQEKPKRVMTDSDWYSCQAITGTEQTITTVGCGSDACPEPSCDECPECSSCPEPPCESCDPSCNSAESGSDSSSSDSSGDSSEGSPSATPQRRPAYGLTACCENSDDEDDDCDCPQATDNGNKRPLAQCDGTIHLFDPMGTIGDANPYAVPDDEGYYYIPAGTLVYVQHLDDAYDEDGNPLYEPTGGWGDGCQCCPSVPCPSCGSSCECPDSCPSCNSCGSESSGPPSGSGQSGSGQGCDPCNPPGGGTPGWMDLTDCNGVTHKVWGV